MNFPSLHQDFQVRFDYSVHFTAGVFNVENPLLARLSASGGDLPKKLLLVVDAGLYQHHPDLLLNVENYCRRHRRQIVLAGKPLILPGGEGVKNDPDNVSVIHRAINRAGLCRHSYVLVAGGGAVIDAAGYAAATAHRGLRLIRLPTTVMAQADAAIGVKNSINAFDKKNFLGTFAPPWAVINDCSFLTTLSRRDWLSGLAEAVKVALIKDAEFFNFLEKSAPALVNRDLGEMQQVIYRCAALHLEHITRGGDPFESGSSRPLDFGHWAAHKLENLSGHRLRHGEAVAIGIALDVTYSYLAGMLGFQDWQRILNLLERLGLPLGCPWLAAESEVLRGLKDFREHLGGLLTIILLQGIGRPVEINKLDQKLMAIAITLHQSQDGGGIQQSGVLYQILRSTQPHPHLFQSSPKVTNSPLN